MTTSRVPARQPLGVDSPSGRWLDFPQGIDVKFHDVERLYGTIQIVGGGRCKCGCYGEIAQRIVPETTVKASVLQDLWGLREETQLMVPPTFKMVPGEKSCSGYPD